MSAELRCDRCEATADAAQPAILHVQENPGHRMRGEGYGGTVTIQAEEPDEEDDE